MKKQVAVGSIQFINFMALTTITFAKSATVMPRRMRFNVVSGHIPRTDAQFFNSITSGWIDYSHNLLLVSLFSHALVSSQIGHTAALEEIKMSILQMKQQAGMA